MGLSTFAGITRSAAPFKITLGPGRRTSLAKAASESFFTSSATSGLGSSVLVEQPGGALGRHWRGTSDGDRHRSDNRCARNAAVFAKSFAEKLFGTEGGRGLIITRGAEFLAALLVLAIGLGLLRSASMMQGTT